MTARVKIWRYNARTGYWEFVRDSFHENLAEWLRVLRADEPSTHFKAAQYRPRKAPTP